LSKALVSEQIASQPGWLQSLDPRVRLAGIMTLVIAVVLSRRIAAVAGILAVAIFLAIMSRVSIASLAKRVWLVIFGFTGLIALPALFVTPGTPLLGAAGAHWTITEQGLRTAALLILRVEAAVTLTTVLVLSTPWNHLLKALRSARVPAEIVTMLAMTHRYIFVLIESAAQMFESRKSRAVGSLTATQRRQVAARTAGVLMSKSMELGHDVYLAMISRGFTGEAQVLTEFRMKTRDYIALASFLCAAGVAIYFGRS
jgi:cobalt ECF transporter T component CbiQ